MLAGGRGQRMGGVDKGLQTLHGQPLVAHVLRRLAPQVGALLISANRHPDTYAAIGAPFGATVVADTRARLPGTAGRLARRRCAPSTALSAERALRLALAAAPILPCASPHALDSNQADIATAATVDADGNTSLHPVFALLRTGLADDLSAFLDAGERKVRAWYARHKTVEVVFTDERAFYNANSLQELAILERDRGSG